MAALTALNRKKAALTAVNWRKSGSNGAEPEKIAALKALNRTNIGIKSVETEN